MSQAISGHRVGNGFTILFGNYDPNNTPAGADALTGYLDWVYFRLGSGSAATWLYRCDTSVVLGAAGAILQPAHWTAK